MNKPELVAQTRLAFEFLQKLYFEVSYLIKEMDALLQKEEEEFVFGRGSGYAVLARSSNGLEPYMVNLWMYRKLAIYFIPKSFTKIVKGQTITEFVGGLKILYMRIILDDKQLHEPTIYFGVLKDFKRKTNLHEKIEKLMTTVEYIEEKVFADYEKVDHIDYADTNISFKGKLARVDLFDINTSEDISKKIIMPALKIFRETTDLPSK